jgi:ubiquinone/menaquinone biosynthesis C-methylase UbiE
LKKNTIESNLQIWDSDYAWPKDGDEWDGQAKKCNKSYEAWKHSLVQAFIQPNVARSSTVLEIGPGHGRWSKEIAPLCGHLILVDLSPRCIEHCQSLLKERPNVTFIVNGGKDLTGIPNGSVDFLWSYDVFVHISPAEIEAYFSEINRVLRPNNRAIIHHAGRCHLFLPLRFLRNSVPIGHRFYNYLTMSTFEDDDGWRSDVSRVLVRRLAKKHGLIVEDQVNRWGKSGDFGVPRFRDAISILRRPE